MHADSISIRCAIASAILADLRWPAIPAMRASLAVKSLPMRMKLSRLRLPERKSDSFSDKAWESLYYLLVI